MTMPECRLTAGLAIAVVLSGCAAPEQSLLEEFFGASRLRDTTALQRVSTVVFEPLQQGIVRTFEITDVTPERMDGQQAVAKDVTILAQVVLPDGQTVQKTLLITLQRGSGSDSSRWMVTGVRDAAALPTVPPS